MNIKYIKKFLHTLEVLIFYFTFFLCRLFIRKNVISWTLGVTENCKNMYYFNKIIPNSYTACFNSDYYTPQLTYNFLYKKKKFFFLNRLSRFFIGPILFAILCIKSKNFLFFWNDGFLSFDENREFQFKFLKKNKKKVACFFCGSEIRSYYCSLKLEKKFNLDNQIRYRLLGQGKKNINDFEMRLKEFCKITDKYADIIFNYETDQISYLKKKCYPFFYNFESKKFQLDLKKFNNLKTVKIVHAPTNPIIKGTPIIRAVIQKLKKLNYNIEYHELVDLKNSEVLKELKDAHIVINELYGYSPGLFSIEGMFSSCMVITSASEKFEKLLPKNSSKSWVVGNYLNLEKQLLYYLNRKEKIRIIAEKGYKWAQTNANLEKNKLIINKILNS
ncbi:hypothetical protein ABXT72_00750 [Candidatus Pelagibacter sp. Uisw_094]|uniref:hypothetical protein n=1 Tax=Candidatus Pelagibacter sp. Uisw_094 TaxID=3230980 RepID=UPI0039EACA3E